MVRRLPADRPRQRRVPDGWDVADVAQQSPAVGTLQALQAGGGNAAVSRLIAGAGPGTPGMLAQLSGLGQTAQPAVQRSFLDTLTRGAGALSHGADVYGGMSDEGAPFARELMRWRLLGLGMDFAKTPAHGDWNTFMAARPEIQRALAPKLEQLATGWLAGPDTGSAVLGGYQAFSDQIVDVRLNELESMRLTLHGCHRIEITGRYWVGTEEGMRTVRIFPTLVWVDRADLHPGTTTELQDGAEVDDREFTAAGFDYDIRIAFEPGVSVWQDNGGVVHARGWPPVTGAPAAGFRG